MGPAGRGAVVAWWRMQPGTGYATGVVRRWRAWRVSPRSFQLVAAMAVWALVLTIVSGAAVRLTGSGLGCPDWPNCTRSDVVAPLQFHAWVEFGNRLINAAVTIAALGRPGGGPAPSTPAPRPDLAVGRAGRRPGGRGGTRSAGGRLPAGARPGHGPLPARDGLSRRCGDPAPAGRPSRSGRARRRRRRRPSRRRSGWSAAPRCCSPGSSWRPPPSPSPSGRSSPPPALTAGLRTPRGFISRCTRSPSCTAPRWSCCSASPC